MKRYFNVFMMLAGLACVFCTSCETLEVDAIKAPFLILDKDDAVQSFTAEGQTKQLSVYASQRDIHVTVTPIAASSWCTVVVESGTLGESIVSVSVKENEVKEGRQARISLAIGDYKPQVFTVAQAGIVLPIVITDFEPKIGGRSDVIRLYGDNFGDIASNIKVFFGETPAEVIFTDGSEIEVSVPTMASEAGSRISIHVNGFEATFDDVFTYKKRWWVENVKVDVLPSAIAVDESGKHLVYLRRFEDNRLGGRVGVYRIDLTTNEQTYVVGYDFVEGNYGYTGITYDSFSKKFYVMGENGGTALNLVSIDPSNDWRLDKHAVEAGVDGYWSPGLTMGRNGLLYTRQWNGAVIEVDTKTWQARTVGYVIVHGGMDTSPAIVFSPKDNQVHVQVRTSSEYATIDVASGAVTWLNTSTETGYFDGPLASARFLRGEQLCVDAHGNVFVVDQDNHAIRKVGTDNVVTTVMGGNGAGGVNGNGEDAKFTAPSGIAMDAAGTMYIADTWNASVRRAYFQ